MSARKETTLSRRDPFDMLREMTSEFDRFFEDPFRRSFRWPAQTFSRTESWAPEIDVFEKDGRLITKVDLPGMKREDVKVEVADGHLAVSGERKSEVEEKKDDFYRCEREYGSFYRAVPLPEGAKLDDVKATFADGVLEVSVPLPKVEAPKARKIEIEGATATPTKAA